MTMKEVFANMDVQEFLKQKNWLVNQIKELEPSGSEATQIPEGLLHFLDEIQDAAEGEYGIGFVPFPETEEVIEWCSHCEREVTLSWNCKEDGLKAFCPYCGEKLMLCGYCPATYIEITCDYNSSTDTCKFSQKLSE